MPKINGKVTTDSNAGFASWVSSHFVQLMEAKPNWETTNKQNRFPMEVTIDRPFPKLDMMQREMHQKRRNTAGIQLCQLTLII